MKTTLKTLILIIILLQSILYGRLPGGDDDTNIYRGFGYFSVKYVNGNPVPNHKVEFYMQLNFEVYGEIETLSDTIIGYTDSDGNASLIITLSAPEMWGFPVEQFLNTHSESDAGECCNILGSQYHYYTNTFTVNSNYEYRFQDCDGNDILDSDEILLSEYFCPTYVLNSSTDYVRPEPVQYLGVSREDLWFELSSIGGQTLGTYPISYEAQCDPPVSSFHVWMNGPTENISWLDHDALEYTGCPPGNTVGNYYLRFMYNYEGACNSESCWSDYYNTERLQNNYPNTVYTHLFMSGEDIIIQYWTYYPYNDFINNHESDWEHINVWLDSKDPQSAQITKVEYYFHHKYLVANFGTFDVENITHSIVYVGGGSSIAQTTHSGAHFPQAQNWTNVEMVFDELVVGDGPAIHYSTFYDNNYEDEYGIVILPDIDDVDYNDNPELSWFKIQVPWGYLYPDTWNGWINNFIGGFTNVGNYPPSGPAYRAGWNCTGSDEGLYELYPWNPTNPCPSPCIDCHQQ